MHWHGFNMKILFGIQYSTNTCMYVCSKITLMGAWWADGGLHNVQTDNDCFTQYFII